MDAPVLQAKRLHGPVLEEHIGVVAAPAQGARQQVGEKIAIETRVHARRFVRAAGASPGRTSLRAASGKVSKGTGMKRDRVWKH